MQCYQQKLQWWVDEVELKHHVLELSHLHHVLPGLASATLWLYIFPGYMQLQALCAPHKRGKPSGTMTKQTGLIPVTLFCFLSPARCCLPALVSPSLACKILKWFWLECVPSQHLPHPYCHTITCHLINNANMGGSMSNLSPLERHGVQLECWNWSCFCAIPTGTCSGCRSQNASDGELWIINAM